MFVSASVTFDAGHRAAPPAHCGLSSHGHRWEVRATADAESEIDALISSLAAITSELRYRDLHEMLPGVPATPSGLAHYIRERIHLGVPTLRSVEVSNGEWSSTVTVEKR